ncbi:MAG: carboxypeptidase-like regulatory domain-containing protein [Gemmataceae bacterium]|nr:carboxypeptidase-like regulatory domain-containing protein [Gemmataceae bacterium]
MNSRHWIVAGWMVALALAIPGCSGGGNFSRITGQVLLDSKPLSEARVTFEGPSGGNVAVTNEEGKFELDGTSAQKSLKAGKYLVLVSKFVDKKTGQAPPPEEYGQLEASGLGKQVVPFKYTDRENTPLNVDIVEGKNELKPFELKSK